MVFCAQLVMIVNIFEILHSPSAALVRGWYFHMSHGYQPSAALVGGWGLRMSHGYQPSAASVGRWGLRMSHDYQPSAALVWGWGLCHMATNQVLNVSAVPRRPWSGLGLPPTSTYLGAIVCPPQFPLRALS